MKSNFTLLALLAILFFAPSCKKNTDNSTLPTIDSLAAGWQKINSGINSQIEDIWFLNESKGFCCAGTGIYSSTDSGKKWTIVPLSPKGCFNLQFVNDNTGYALMRDSIAVTNNGGSSWETRKMPRTNFMDIYFISSSTGFAFGSGTTYKTTDSAKTWTVFKTENSRSLYFLNDTTGFSHFYDGYCYSITNGATNWQKISQQILNAGSGWEYLYFSDVNNGWLVISSIGLHKTVDGGVTWANVLPGNFIDCSFPEKQYGFVCGDNFIYSTTDAGITWKRDVKTTAGTVIELHFVNKNTGWACGLNGLIFRYKK